MNKQNIQPATISIQLTRAPDEDAQKSIARATDEKLGSLIWHKWGTFVPYPVGAEGSVIVFIKLGRNPAETLEEDLESPITEMEVFKFCKQHGLVYAGNEDLEKLGKLSGVEMDGKRYFVVNDKCQAIAALASRHGDMENALWESIEFPCAIVHDPECLGFTRFAFKHIPLSEFRALMDEEYRELQRRLQGLLECMNSTSLLIETDHEQGK